MEAKRLEIASKLEKMKTDLEFIASSDYLTFLEGTLGADPVHGGFPVEDQSSQELE